MTEIIHGILIAYAGVGTLIGTAFVVRGAPAVAAGAKGTGIGFRLIIWPGAVGLWPLALWRWIGARR